MGNSYKTKKLWNLDIIKPSTSIGKLQITYTCSTFQEKNVSRVEYDGSNCNGSNSIDVWNLHSGLNVVRPKYHPLAPTVFLGPLGVGLIEGQLYCGCKDGKTSAQTYLNFMW